MEGLTAATEAGAAALHRARGHEGDWRPAGCDCADLAWTVIQAAGAVLGAEYEQRLARLEGRPPRPVPGAPPAPLGPEPPPPRRTSRRRE